MKSLLHVALVVLCTCLAQAASAALVVTEVMSSSSHPTGGKWDWFELYNSGPGAVNLSGYSWVDDNSSHTNVFFPPWQLPAGKTLLVTEAPVGAETAFRNMWGLPTNQLVYNMGTANFWGLGSGGDFVKVFDPSTTNPVALAVFGTATAGATFHWSREGTYLGISQAGQYGAYVAPSNGVDGAGTDVGSPGITVSVPTLSTFVVGLLPAALSTAMPSQSITIHSRSISNGLASIGFGRTSNGTGWTWMTNLVTSLSNGLYYAQTSIIPPVPGIYYYAARWEFNGFSCYAWNHAGQTNQIVLNAEYTLLVTNAIRAPYPGELLITEVMASSSHTNSAINGDWFELYYFGTEPATLAGCSFNDSANVPGLNVFPDIPLLPGSVIAMVDEGPSNIMIFKNVWGLGGATNIFSRAVLVAGEVPGLSSSGDQLRLYDPLNEQITAVSFGASSNGFSFYWPPETDPFSPGAPLTSTDGLDGAWRAPGGSDVASPGVVVPEPATALLLLLAFALRRRAS